MRLLAAFITAALWPALACAATGPATEPSSPEAFLAEIEALPRPLFDESRLNDEKYVKQYTDQTNRIWQRQAELESEFYQRLPKNPRAELLYMQRWGTQLNLGRDPAAISAEVAQFLMDHPNGPRSNDAQRSLAMLQMRQAKGRADRKLDVAEAFIKANPHNEFGGNLLMTVAADLEGVERDKLLRRIIDDYPSSESAILAGGKLRQVSQIGMPFDLWFNDVTTNKWTTTKDLRGKVLIVEFWATWCAPCVGEIPHLKELYGKYTSQGLEILGVSLDGPRTCTSVETLKSFLRTKQIEWPQYYQGDSFDSWFSRSWGIDSIPAMFVIDRAGNLRSTDGRKNLDQLVGELLAVPQADATDRGK